MTSEFDFFKDEYDVGRIQQLINVCSNDNTLGVAEGKIANIVENLSSFIKVMSTKDLICQSTVCKLIDTVLKIDSIEILARFQKVLPKVIKICLNLAESKSSNQTIHFSFNVLLCLVSNLKRNITQTSNILDICKSYIHDPIHHNIAGQVLATIVSHDSPQQWIIYWNILTSDLLKVLSHFDIFSFEELKIYTGKESVLEESILQDLIRCNQQRVGDSENVELKIETLFLGLINTLIHMLNIGCCNGPVSLDLNTLLPMLHVILLTNLKPKQEKNTYNRNKSGYTQFELATILPKIKLQSLKLLDSILKTRHPSLLRFCGLIMDPILSLLNNDGTILFTNATNTFDSSSLSVKLLEVIILMVQTFPSLFSKPSSLSGVAVLIDTFHTEISQLTQSDATIAAISSINNNNSNNVENGMSLITKSNQYYNLLFQVMEMLLLFCGSNLPSILRQKIELSLSKALFCLTKGIVPYVSNQTENRHLKRCRCEQLRGSLFIVNAVIKLACTEVLIPNVDGVMSVNVTLLKNVCKVCLQYNETSYEAARTLASIDALLFPVMVTLPSHHSILNQQMISNAVITYHNGASSYAQNNMPSINTAENKMATSDSDNNKYEISVTNSSSEDQVVNHTSEQIIDQVIENKSIFMETTNYNEQNGNKKDLKNNLPNKTQVVEYFQSSNTKSSGHASLKMTFSDQSINGRQTLPYDEKASDDSEISIPDINID